MIKLLLNAGGDIAATNIYGGTPLYLAGRAKTVFALLEAGADPRLQDKEGVTILHNLLRFGGSCEHVARALVAHGADIEARDLNGYTPLHYACRSYDESSLAELLDSPLLGAMDHVGCALGRLLTDALFDEDDCPGQADTFGSPESSGWALR